MKTLNATQACNCGRWKRESVNFCTDCWNAIPLKVQDRYTACAKDLHDIILECRTILRQKRKK
jgi:hypothetical protein